MKARISAIDFLIPLFTKLPIVLVSNFFLLSVTSATLFIALRWVGALNAATYVVKVFFLVALCFCIFAALRFNSKSFLRAMCAARKSSPIFLAPHPLVRSSKPEDTLNDKVRRLTAIALIEAKSYTIAYGTTFLILYIAYLYFIKHFSRNELSCKATCEVLLFAVKSIGSGIIFDFFDHFHINITDIDSHSISIEMLSFVSKLVFVGLVLRIITLYLNFRRRYSSVLRESPITREQLTTAEATYVQKHRPSFSYIVVPPFLANRKGRDNRSTRN
jgi:hypothetical protein